MNNNYYFNTNVYLIVAEFIMIIDDVVVVFVGDGMFITIAFFLLFSNSL